MNEFEKRYLVDEALAKITTDGSIAAMNWLADSVEAKYNEKLQKALTRNEINDKLLFQIMNY
jgi:cobalamin biosynthesis protein CbiD